MILCSNASTVAANGISVRLHPAVSEDKINFIYYKVSYFNTFFVKI